MDWTSIAMTVNSHMDSIHSGLSTNSSTKVRSPPKITNVQSNTVAMTVILKLF